MTKLYDVLADTWGSNPTYHRGDRVSVPRDDEFRYDIPLAVANGWIIYVSGSDNAPTPAPAGNAPDNAHYLTSQAESGLSAELVLSAVIGYGVTGSRPAAGTAGRLYFNTSTGRLQRDNATSWDDVEPTLDLLPTAAGNVSLGSHKLTAVTDPTSAQDAATKAYVDGLIQGVAWKNPVRAATTANGTLATAFANGQVIDGVTLATGNRILLKNQTTGSENGIYVVAASGAPSRATDTDAGAELLNAAVFVEEGTANADTVWVCTTDAPITPGSTSLSFTQFGAGTISSITIREIDTSPSVAATALEVTNGHLTDQGSGVARLDVANAWSEITSKPTLDAITAPTADLSLNSHKITSVTDPTSAQDAATKAYVDNAVAGLSWKQAVRAATTANGTLATAFANGQVIDGVTLATGNRILLKNQTTGSENGIYVVAASGAPARATDADAGAELVNAAVFVAEGTTLADTVWVCTNNATPTLGSTSLVFAQFGAGSFNNPMTTQDDLIVGGASGAGARLAKGSDSQVLTVDPSTHHLVWATPTTPTTPALVKLAETIVAGSSVATITFGSISQAYRDLEIHITGRSTASATNDGVSFRANNDSSAVYDMEQTFQVNTSVGGAGTTGNTTANVGGITGATAPANTPGTIKITIFDYARTAWFKSYHSFAYDERSVAAGSQVSETYAGIWRSTAAISSLVFALGSGNFAIDTVISLYGRG